MRKHHLACGAINSAPILDIGKGDSYIMPKADECKTMHDIEDIIIRTFRESCHLKEMFVNENVVRIVTIVDVMTNALKEGKKILLFGNGGSAADAQHLAAEFINRFIIERPPLPAIALSTDTSVITSISNDYDYSDVFAKQIRALGQSGDIAWGITTSGSSPNVIKAFEAARKLGMITVALTGKDGGNAEKVADYILNVSSNSVPRIQEVHITVGHVICQMIDYKLFQKPGE
jgi:D-sedoheptulose 7-phosphate isomerase